MTSEGAGRYRCRSAPCGRAVAQFLEIPTDRVSPEALDALLEEFASRDGTDYGERERSLAQKTASLRCQLAEGALRLLYDLESESWDIVAQDQARELVRDEPEP